jgi:hypothetical protein
LQCLAFGVRKINVQTCSSRGKPRFYPCYAEFSPPKNIKTTRE